MAIRHTVQPGDHLWGLAHQFLGSGTRYPEIVEEHNKEAARAARFGLFSRLIPIKDPNLIFVGQTIIIPSGKANPAPGSGTRAQGEKRAVPVNLKVVYTIGRDTPPVHYISPHLDYTVKTELSGEIGIEIMSPDKYLHGLELSMSKNPMHMQVKQKLHDVYDPALCALTADQEMVFESGAVRIKSPIAAQAEAGLYTVRVQAETPNTMSGTLKPPTISGIAKVLGREYKYNADIEFKVEVVWHQRPQGGPGAAKFSEYKRLPLEIEENSVNWKEFAAKVTWTIVGTALMLLGCRQATMVDGTTSITPFVHTINPNNPRNPKYLTKNAS